LEHPFGKIGEKATPSDFRVAVACERSQFFTESKAREVEIGMRSMCVLMVNEFSNIRMEKLVKSCFYAVLPKRIYLRH